MRSSISGGKNWTVSEKERGARGRSSKRNNLEKRKNGKEGKAR